MKPSYPATRPTKTNKSNSYNVGKSREILDAIGHENEKQGIKWTKYFMDKFDREEMDKNQLREEKLKKNRMTKKRYFQLVATMLYELLLDVDKPSHNWKVSVYPTDMGVVTQIKNIGGRIFQRAFTPCGIPKVDLNAVNEFLGSAEDAMYEFEENGVLDIKTKNGIYLP